MKTVLFLTILSMASMAFAQNPSNPCEAKKADILLQIEKAKAANNKAQVAGLEKALSEVNANCTPELVIKEKADKLNKLQQKIHHRMEELKKAEASGKAKKIEKAKKKLQEAEQEYQNEKL